MSETIIEDVAVNEPPAEDDRVSVDDLKRMLDESRTSLATIQRERDDERASRLLAETERDTATSRVVSETEQRWVAQKQAVESSLAAADGEAEKAERDYASAAETGDWQAAAKAQRMLAGAEARALQLRGQKEFLETNKARMVQPAEAPRQAASTDRYGAVVKDLKPGEREWLDDRPQFLSDERYRARVMAYSQAAWAEGHARGTPEYFRRMEEMLGESGQVTTEAPRERRQSSDIAPQRRAAPGAAAASTREIRLNADQVEIADGLYGNPSSADFIADPGERYKKYHANLQRMKATGRMQ